MKSNQAKCMYVPRHAMGDTNHHDVEGGVMTGFNHMFAFVKYDSDNHTKSTKWSDLYFVDVWGAKIKIISYSVEQFTVMRSDSKSAHTIDIEPDGYYVDGSIRCMTLQEAINTVG